MNSAHYDAAAPSPVHDPAWASILDRILLVLEATFALALGVCLFFQTQSTHRIPTLVEILAGRLRLGLPVEITPLTDELLALAPWAAFVVFALLQSVILYRRAPMYRYGPFSILVLTCLPVYNLAGTILLFGAYERLLIDRGRPLTGLLIITLAWTNVVLSVALAAFVLIEPTVSVPVQTYELTRWALLAVRLGLAGAAFEATRWLVEQPLPSPVPALAAPPVEGVDSGIWCPACNKAALVVTEGQCRELVCPDCRRCVVPPAAARAFVRETLGFTHEQFGQLLSRAAAPGIPCPSCEALALTVTLRGVPVQLCASCPTIGLDWSALPDLMTPLGKRRPRAELARPRPPSWALSAGLFLLVGVGATEEYRSRQVPPCANEWTGGWRRKDGGAVVLACTRQHVGTVQTLCANCRRPTVMGQLSVTEYREESVSGVTVVEGEYRGDDPVGVWNYYDDLGRRQREKRYTANELTGETGFFPSGVVEHTGEYESGVKSGIWKVFERTGLIVSCETWLAGALQSSDCPELPARAVETAQAPAVHSPTDMLFGGRPTEWWASRMKRLAQDKSANGVELLRATRERAVLNDLVVQEAPDGFTVTASDDTLKLAARLP